MIGLHGTKVFVLDDEPSEALPIMQAFARRALPLPISIRT